MTITIQAASISDYPVIQNMARFYVYDLSRECGCISDDWAIPANGLYESFDFKPYFEEPTRKAFLINVNNELAGFILLNQVCLYDKSDWNIGEFFVLAKFQGKGIGKEAALAIWKMHPGFFEVSVIPENKHALQFWQKTIHDFTNGQYKKERTEVDFDQHQPYRILFIFDSRLHFD